MVSPPDIGTLVHKYLHCSLIKLKDLFKPSCPTMKIYKYLLREISLTHLKIIKQLTIKLATVKTRDWF